MKLPHWFFSFTLLICAVSFGQNEKQYKVTTIAFYNVENLFDYEDDPLIFDDDRTPEGKDHWTQEIYEAKLANMAKVISEIGEDVTGTSPTIIGLSEIENRRVLEDLLNQAPLVSKDYGIVHFDSPDRRGIDVALLYQKKLFTPTNYKAYELLLYDDEDRSKRIYTRDQLLVSGMLDGEKIHVIVNHWPSRSGGEARSRPKRIKAAELNRHIMDSLFSEDPYAKIITMGDLNDDPTNQSVKDILKAKSEREDMKLKELYNPMEDMFKKGLGTLAYRDGWNLFDQIIISTELTKKEYSSYRFYKAGIFNKNYLATPRGQYKGYPFRSFVNGYTGGYSDHFPVFIYLIKEK
ncbi:endonuclease/exonuclease/phosphatase family protein [Aequorivita vladivostokensis]|jgi:endonuclease/exonuclease/phosphatase family metal-dependent hydrolase|uniref:Endonuclease n=1 Tax=Aequorivita vladivostokensis TaxID=171194 RepID=A0ABR5DI67_9FLAO|nr:endonuclease [Aequorivita vladivostokensis]MAB56487.1 endonuclease [Aequorivita sp.]KJJ38479.1 endonuclease [Aequorivita vladivostokensis]MAO47912.1 endonuclease [Aequorivita sp.]MBF29863.1 endonuclease [Aequorivita sp.]HBL79937.1 endonuclease [Aequorivita sp.]|tara:strand:- start:45349 stop:46395 length:1047 start_codon:yes stop_codon:yes gene_type:complete